MIYCATQYQYILFFWCQGNIEYYIFNFILSSWDYIGSILVKGYWVLYRFLSKWSLRESIKYVYGMNCYFISIICFGHIKICCHSPMKFINFKNLNKWPIHSFVARYTVVHFIFNRLQLVVMLFLWIGYY